MKKIKVLISLIAAIFLIGGTLSAQTDIFLTAKEFMDLQKSNKELIILDAAKSSIFNDFHIKDAIHINHNDLYREGEIQGMIKSPEELAKFFGNKGVSETDEIVVYDDGTQKYSTRVFWVLKYLGVENVKILHKDMAEWRKVRIPIISFAGDVEAKTFTPKVNPDVLATLDYVKESKDLDSVILLDARAEVEYTGADGKSQGHIPGAIHLEYKELLTDNGAFKPIEELKEIVAAKGITPNKELLMYCRTSVRAAVLYVAFKEILKYEKVRVYDGAYLEWIVNNPIVQ